MLSKSAILASFALASIFATSAEGAVLLSLDRATFVAASGSLSGQNFDALPAGTTLTTVGPVTFGSSVGTPVVTSQFLTTTSPNGLGRTTQNFFSSTDAATFTFLNAISAFAIDINTFATAAGSFDVVLNTGDQAFSIFETFPRAGTGQFIGFVSDTPFSTVTLTANTGASFTLDTLLFGSRAAVVGAVPEPGTWAMMLIGFGAIGGALRKRRPASNAQIA